MTSETKASTEPWIKEKNARYAYAYDKSGALMAKFGFSGLPSAALIDPFGEVVWTGHPASLDESTIKSSLAGSLASPLFQWPATAKAARKAFAAGQVAKAIAEAKKLGTEGESLAAGLEAHAAASVVALQEAHKAGEYLTVEKRGALFQKRLAGLAQVADVEALLKELAADAKAQEILAAQKSIAKLTSGKIKKGDVAKIRKELGEIEQRYPDTAAARDAKRAIASLMKD